MNVVEGQGIVAPVPGNPVWPDWGELKVKLLYTTKKKKIKEPLFNEEYSISETSRVAEGLVNQPPTFLTVFSIVLQLFRVSVTTGSVW